MKKLVPPPTRGFTLIEMLTVLSVVAILTSFSLGILKNSMTSMTSEGNHLADLVALAQQNASGKNRATALVFAQFAGGEQGFAVYQLAPADTAAAPVPGDWQQVTAWKFLPDGVALDKGAASTFLATPTVTPGLQLGKVGGRTVESFAYQVFLPDNQLVTNGTATAFPTLRLVRGTYQGGALVRLEKGSANYYDILINPATGRAIVERP